MVDRKIIGFDRKIQLEWLDLVADWASQGIPHPKIREELDSVLADQVLGDAKGGARSKTVTVLTRIWLNVPKHLVEFRDKGLGIFRGVSSKERMLLHLGMTMANYRFVFDVLTQIGRLTNLQDEFSTAQIDRRIIEEWGNTQRVSRSVRHVIQSLRLWMILRQTNSRGYYKTGPQVIVKSKKLKKWMLHAFLLSYCNPASIDTITNHPSLFFMKLELNTRDLAKTKNFEIINHSLGDCSISLR